MKVLTVLSGLLEIVASLPTDKLLSEKWTSFRLNFGKTYSTLNEESKRFAIFKENLQKIDAHNELYEAGKSTYKMGVNKFTDLSQEEFRSLFSIKLSATGQRQTGQTHIAQTTDVLPNEVDWRKNGSVTEVKDEGLVGSSLPFSVTGAVEGAYQRASGSLISLSEKNLEDCSNYTNVDDIYNYILDNGIESEDSYPLDGNNTCKANSTKIVTKISSFVNVEQTADDLASAVATVGPISILIEITEDIVYYISGIVDDQSCYNDGDEYLNHAALVVGYGTEDDIDYWIIKNTWGPNWGEDGYFRIVRNQENRCNIYSKATYPVI